MRKNNLVVLCLVVSVFIAIPSFCAAQAIKIAPGISSDTFYATMSEYASKKIADSTLGNLRRLVYEKGTIDDVRLLRAEAIFVDDRLAVCRLFMWDGSGSSDTGLNKPLTPNALSAIANELTHASGYGSGCAPVLDPDTRYWLRPADAERGSEETVLSYHRNDNDIIIRMCSFKGLRLAQEALKEIGASQSEFSVVIYASGNLYQCRGKFFGVRLGDDYETYVRTLRSGLYEEDLLTNLKGDRDRGNGMREVEFGGGKTTYGGVHIAGIMSVFLDDRLALLWLRFRNDTTDAGTTAVRLQELFTKQFGERLAGAKKAETVQHIRDTFTDKMTDFPEGELWRISNEGDEHFVHLWKSKTGESVVEYFSLKDGAEIHRRRMLQKQEEEQLKKNNLDGFEGPDVVSPEE